MGRPARMRVRNCWLKMRNGSSLTLRRLTPEAAAGLDGEDVVAGMGEAGAQFLGGGRGLHLLLNAAALIGQLDYELCHAIPRRAGTRRARWSSTSISVSRVTAPAHK